MPSLLYKDYQAVLEYDRSQHRLIGTVPGLPTDVKFEARHVDELDSAFQATIDAYLERCAEAGEKPFPPLPASPFGTVAAVAGEQALLRDLYYGSEFAIFLIDVEETAPESERFRFAAINPAYERITGILSAQMVGQTPQGMAFIFGQEGAGAIQENYQRCLDAEVTIAYEEPLNVNGRDTWWLTNLTPLRDADGRIFRIVGSAAEITVQKETQAELVRAKEKAEEADRAKSAFLATMSHEFRTPLNGIIGFANLLASLDLDEEAAEYVAYIESSGETLLSLIGDVLDFSKIEAQQLQVEEVPFSLTAVVESALKTVAVEASGKGLELAYRLEPTVPAHLLGDPLRLQQVVMNLLSNAVKFTDEGGVVVRVNADRIGDTTFEVHISVADTGVGIAPDDQHNLFKPFHQVDTSDTRRYGGTGLGLAISRRLAGLMGGGIWVESEQGVGSTFHFTAVLKVDAEQPATVAGEAVRRADLAGRSVLVVDDIAINRRLLQLALEDWGIAVTEAGSGYEALAALESKHFDAALVDVQMPGMDGVTLVRRIRARYPNDALPLILMSSAHESSLIEDGLVETTLFKPVTFDRLRLVLEGIVPVKSPADAAAVEEVASEMPAEVLVVEDQPTNLRVTLAMLRRLGIKCDVATNGREALDALAAHAYRLVLMDIRMPAMDGVEATRRIREASRDQYDPYIIALTAQAMQGDRERFLDAGMNDYVTKPLRMPDLHAAIERYRQAVAR